MLQPASVALRMMRGVMPGAVARGSSILFLAQFN